ncbi:MAG: rRNA adenine N-6-methyltransferase family protein, partial [Geobacteraceae bacterium]
MAPRRHNRQAGGACLMDRLRPNKSLGQHFLTDTSLLSRIVELVKIASGDRILEVGPGRG